MDGAGEGAEEWAGEGCPLRLTSSRIHPVVEEMDARAAAAAMEEIPAVTGNGTDTALDSSAVAVAVSCACE